MSNILKSFITITLLKEALEKNDLLHSFFNKFKDNFDEHYQSKPNLVYFRYDDYDYMITFSVFVVFPISKIIDYDNNYFNHWMESFKDTSLVTFLKEIREKFYQKYDRATLYDDMTYEQAKATVKRFLNSFPKKYNPSKAKVFFKMYDEYDSDAQKIYELNRSDFELMIDAASNLGEFFALFEQIDKRLVYDYY